MASILEMTVDYLKIVNSNLPHEFHAHVLDVMTKGGNSPPARTARASVACGGRGSRGGRGRGSRRASQLSPSPCPTLQDNSSQGRLGSHLVSRGVMSSPVRTSTARGNGGSRGGRGSKRSASQSMVMSPGSQGVSSLYLVDNKERGAMREETVICNTMTLPTYIQPSPYSAPSHIFDASSSSSSSTSVHTFPSPPPPPGMVAPSEGGVSMPRLYASALAVDPGFLAHGPVGNSLPSRFPIPADREVQVSSNSSGLAGPFGDPTSGGAAFYHYYPPLPDINPAYTVAGGGGMGVGVPVPMCGDFMTSASLHPLTPASSAFTPSRLQLAPSSRGGKVDATSQSVGSGEGVGDGAVYCVMEVSPKTTTK